jgi:hypothetical protein
MHQEVKLARKNIDKKSFKTLNKERKFKCEFIIDFWSESIPFFDDTASESSDDSVVDFDFDTDDLDDFVKKLNKKIIEESDRYIDYMFEHMLD